jgi:hypothetical protein
MRHDGSRTSSADPLATYMSLQYSYCILISCFMYQVQRPQRSRKALVLRDYRCGPADQSPGGRAWGASRGWGPSMLHVHCCPAEAEHPRGQLSIDKPVAMVGCVLSLCTL